ncbi:MAG: MTH938/NDUFAF3 family protein [Mariprofundales bacterium]|nr:MTH938/NDUFAF3 family protein [Mariprofundales bacterium]
MFRGYDDGFFTIGTARVASSLTIHHHQLEAPWPLACFAELAIEHLQWLCEQPPEMLLLGSGRVTAFPSEAVMAWLHEYHIPVESMDSRAAARTWNILMGEGRNASCAMLLPGV